MYPSKKKVFSVFENIKTKKKKCDNQCQKKIQPTTQKNHKKKIQPMKNEKKPEKNKKKKVRLSKKMKICLMFGMGVFCSFWNDIHGV